jgi:hypothetical protein
MFSVAHRAADLMTAIPITAASMAAAQSKPPLAGPGAHNPSPSEEI